MKICPDCKRHVRLSDALCPFCGTGVPMITAWALAASLGLAAGMTGCGPAVDAGNSMDGSTGSTGGRGTTDSPPVTSGPAVTTATTASTTSSDDGGTSSTSTTFLGSSGGSEESTGAGQFITDPDGGGGVYGLECSVWDQDCARGDKCVPWANDGSDVWNATVCRPIDPQGRAPGEPCSMEDNAVSGFDDCDANSYCFDVDAETLEGTCVAFCGGHELEPTCADSGQTCVIENEGVVTVCLDSCDPLGVACDGDRSCVAVRTETFVCVRPGDSALSEACTQFTDCALGSSCDPSEVETPTCTSPCNPLEGGCEPGSTCQPWGDAGLCVLDEP